MIRLGAIVLATLLFPGLSEAQIPSPAARSHTVRRGDSLSLIAREYYGAASEWDRIFGANRDRLSDPNALEVGTVLAIPEAEPAETAAARVTGVQLGGVRGSAQDALSYDVRRALLQSAPLEPTGIPEVPLNERTVFFDVPDPQDQAAIVVLEAVRSAPALPASVFHAAGWLVHAGDRSDRLGEVVGFADGRDLEVESATGQLYDDVYIRIFAEVRAEVGDEFLVYSISRVIEGLGEVSAPSGRVTVVEVGEGEVIAEIVQEFGRVESGHFVSAAAAFPLEPGVRPSPVNQGAEARILAMQEQKEIYLLGDYAFTDGGRDIGLSIGDELVGLSDDQSDWAGRDLARFQVVGVRDAVGTVRLVETTAPRAVQPGLRVVVDRKMP